MKSLSECPIEILQSIFAYSGVFELYQLSLCSKRIRGCLLHKDFSKQLWKKNSVIKQNISVQALITTEISGIDRIAIHHDDSDSDVLRVTFQNQSKYEILLSFLPSGRMHTVLDSAVDPGVSPLSNLQEGAIVFVDKGYRIFMRTWEDHYSLQTRSGINVSLTIAHEEGARGYGWNQQEPIVTYQIMWNDYRLPLDYVNFLSYLLKEGPSSHPGRSGSGPSSNVSDATTSTISPVFTLFNPYA